MTLTTEKPCSPVRRRHSHPETVDREPAGAWHSGALDGIRATAVIAVLLYHAGVSWFGGGMLGVDMFFALSGFLITTLLVREYELSGTLRFLQFYGRRARRLLPALFLMLVLVAAYAAWFVEPDLLGSVRGDAFATLAYMSNWHFIISDQGYFVFNGAPSPLLHTWSLAIEEQFYLVWPLLVFVVLRRTSTRWLAGVAATGALASVVLTYALYVAGESVNRLYYGSDTRAQAVMVGACLGALGSVEHWFPGSSGWAGRRCGRRLIAGVGLVGAAACLWAVHAVSGSAVILYHGGFALMALATTAVIMAVIAQPRSLLSRVLSLGALGYIGRISYGLYLFHWPIFLMIDHGRTGLGGWQLLTVRLATTTAVAAGSYHFIERPVRDRRFWKGWRLAVALPTALAAVAGALVWSTVGPAAASGPTRSLAVPPASYTLGLERSFGLGPGRPVRVLVLGDSLALTLAMGLGVRSGAWDVQVNNQAVIGCDLDPNSIVNLQSGPGKAAPGCVHWQQTWTAEVQRYEPDVVLIELGRWEVSDRVVNGRWTRIGQPAWDDRYSQLLRQAVAIVTGHGAKVALCTLPYIQQNTEQPDGTPWAINRPVRTDQYNAVIRRAVAGLSEVEVVDLNRLLDPNGHYTSTIGGVRVRDGDNEHPSVAGGELLRPAILPQLVAMGSAHARIRALQP